MHLHLSITSKQIKLHMWDCAQKKALEKIFNLVTDKTCPEWTKGAKIYYRKTCVFFNSRSSIYNNKAEYTVTSIACGWVGAVFEVTWSFGQEQWGQRQQKNKKSSVTNGLTDQQRGVQSCVARDSKQGRIHSHQLRTGGQGRKSAFSHFSTLSLRTNRPTDGHTKPYRVACPQLKSFDYDSFYFFCLHHLIERNKIMHKKNFDCFTSPSQVTNCG